MINYELDIIVFFSFEVLSKSELRISCSEDQCRCKSSISILGELKLGLQSLQPIPSNYPLEYYLITLNTGYFNSDKFVGHLF